MNSTASWMAFVALAALLIVAAEAHAGIVAVSPFVGNENETWESFSNYLSGGFHFLNNPTTIMGGGASISNPKMIVYQPGTGATFRLGVHGEAKVSDGAKGMGIDDGPATTTITFTNPVVAFGAYWGLADYPTYSNTETITFYDAENNVIGAPQTFIYNPPDTNGVLDWHGYTSTEPVAKVTYTGDFTVIDGLQANAVPEPSTILLAVIGTLAAAIRYRRMAR